MGHDRMSTKRRWCLNCGRRIPVECIAFAYATGMMLRCIECGKMTCAIAVDEVAGNFAEISSGGSMVIVAEKPEDPVWERSL